MDAADAGDAADEFREALFCWQAAWFSDFWSESGVQKLDHIPGKAWGPTGGPIGDPWLPMGRPWVAEGSPWGAHGSLLGVHGHLWRFIVGPLGIMGTHGAPMGYHWGTMGMPFAGLGRPRRPMGAHYINKLPINRPIGRYVIQYSGSSSLVRQVKLKDHIAAI